jgi:hypothetical protein
LDRSSNTLVVCGIWFEDRKTAINQAFNDALAKGIARFMRFLSATKLNASAVEHRGLRKQLVSLNGQLNEREASASSDRGPIPIRNYRPAKISVTKRSAPFGKLTVCHNEPES